jgi:hypothetical protein
MLGWRLRKLLRSFIERARQLGLEEKYLKDSEEYLNNSEFGLCFNTIVDQMYEYDTEIDGGFYEMIVILAGKMKLPEKEYVFMRELVR